MGDNKLFKTLPGTVQPKHYRLCVTTNLNSFTFCGEMSVDIEVKKSTTEIKLNSLDLIIDSAKLKNGQHFVPVSTNICSEDEIVCFTFTTPISPGKYNLDISYKGKLGSIMKGYYRSKHVDENGTEKYSALTQFAPTDARLCFPCWDEPAIKATFELSLIVPKDLMALSNTPLKNVEEIGDSIRYNFEKTPKMSTYLVAIVVGQYDFVENISSDNVLVRVYTPKGKKEQGLFALEVASKVLPYYKNYFHVAYPLPKLDLISVPNLSYGAMENWGLITYREDRLLVDPLNTSTFSRQNIALVVGHEVAHQWFGNLVTMNWWTDLWLNEGYASFVEYLCVDHVFPEYDIWSQFINDTYIRALELDSLKNSHPIEVPVKDPSEINEIFDAISYNKGASIIRMLHLYIGDEKFRKGMHLYLTRHQYANSSTEDLWNALEEVSKKPVKNIMSTWTKQMGFPLIKVTSKEKGDVNGVTINLCQTKFTADGSNPPEGYLWMVPISIIASTDTTNEICSTVLTTESAELSIPDLGPADWFKINPGTVGFFRTQYDSEMMDRFIPDIKNGRIPPVDRLGLLDDLFALVKAGQTGTDKLLKFLEAFVNETNHNVWSSIVNILGRLAVILDYTDYKEAFQRYQKKLLFQISRTTGWNQQQNENHLNSLLRSILLNCLASLDDEHTIKEARERFANHINSVEILPADLRTACYKTVLKSGGEEEFNQLLQLYRSSDLNEEKNRICRALGIIKVPELLQKVLNFSMSSEVRIQDSTLGIISVAQTSEGRKLAWNFIINNWKELTARFSGGPLLPRLVKQVAENFADETIAEEIETFFQNNKDSGVERSVHQALETISLNVAWLKRDSEAIRKYLTS